MTESLLEAIASQIEELDKFRWQRFPKNERASIQESYEEFYQNTSQYFDSIEQTVFQSLTEVYPQIEEAEWQEMQIGKIRENAYRVIQVAGGIGTSLIAGVTGLALGYRVSALVDASQEVAEALQNAGLMGGLISGLVLGEHFVKKKLLSRPQDYSRMNEAQRKLELIRNSLTNTNLTNLVVNETSLTYSQKDPIPNTITLVDGSHKDL